MSRHLADHRTPSQGGRLRHFLRIARAERGPWHRSQAIGSNRRVVEFCRIDRGRMA